MPYRPKLPRRITRSAVIAAALTAATVSGCDTPDGNPAAPSPSPTLRNRHAIKAPRAVTDLSATGTSDTTVSLSFTEVDDGTGKPASYDVRLATGVIKWDSASPVTRGTCATPVPGTAIGARRTCTVLGLLPSNQYQFQLVAFRGTLGTDAVLGPLSNAASATTTLVPVAIVVVSPATTIMTVGQTTQFSATLKDSNGNVLTGRTVTWSSSDPVTVPVTSTGRAQALAADTAAITATSEGRSGQAWVTVVTATSTTDAYFNSSEWGCDGSDASALFCDDFESGTWYTVDADHIFTTGGGLAAQKGWYGNIYENPITPPGAAECGSRGFRSGCAATSGYMDGSIGGRNMAEHGFAGGAQLTEAWFRVYFQPQADYDGGHEKMFDFTRGPGTAQIVALCYNYFGSERIRCIPYLHQDDGLPTPAVNAWMGSNVAPELQLVPTHWYFFEMHVRLNTPGSYDGVFEWWLNDCGPDGLGCTGTPTLRGRYTTVKYLNAGTEANVTLGATWIENWANPGSKGTLRYDNVRAARAGPIGFAR